MFGIDLCFDCLHLFFFLMKYVAPPVRFVQGTYGILRNGELVIKDHHLSSVYNFILTELGTSSSFRRTLYERWVHFRRHELHLFQRSEPDLVHLDAVAVLLGTLSVDLDAVSWDNFKEDIVAALLGAHDSQTIDGADSQTQTQTPGNTAVSRERFSECCLIRHCIVD